MSGDTKTCDCPACRLIRKADAISPEVGFQVRSLIDKSATLATQAANRAVQSTNTYDFNDAVEGFLFLANVTEDLKLVSENPELACDPDRFHEVFNRLHTLLVEREADIALRLADHKTRCSKCRGEKV